MISENLIRCGECGVDTEIPTVCAVCLSPLVRRTGKDGKERLSCPHTSEGEGDMAKKEERTYGPSNRDMIPGFGRAVKERRLKLKLSTTKLGELCGIHQTAVSKVETEVRAPSLLLASKLASDLGVTVDVLLQDAARLAHSEE